MAQTVKSLPVWQETRVPSLRWEVPMGKGVAVHASTLAGEFHGQRSLAGYSLWVRKQLDTSEQIMHTHKAHAVTL